MLPSLERLMNVDGRSTTIVEKKERGVWGERRRFILDSN